MRETQNMLKGLLIVISGPSGVGKGTIIQTILKAVSGLTFSVSATTRQPRETEINGIHYHFMNEQEFNRRIESKGFLEWAKVHDDYYGTPRAFVEEKLALGRDLILDIDVQGGLQVQKEFPEGVFIFVAPPTFKSLEERLRLRHTENPEAIKHRLHNAREELRQMKAYQYIVVNDILYEAVEDVKAIIRAERCNRLRRLEEIQHALSSD